MVIFRKKCSNNQNFTTMEKAADNLFSAEKVLQEDLSDFGQKKDFLTREKQGKGACWRCFFKCTSELGNCLSATFSMHYGNEVKSILIQISA